MKYEINKQVIRVLRIITYPFYFLLLLIIWFITDDKTKTMKVLKWNLGIFIIRIGYLIRGNEVYPPYSNIEKIGIFVLKVGYRIRGDIPQKTCKRNHI